MGLGCVPGLLENRYSRKREDVLLKRTSWCRHRRQGGMVGRQTLERSLTARPAATPSGADISTLERLVNWMIANGIQGVDENGMVGLYEDVDGSRGVAALGNIGKGQQLVVLPLRLAIFDDPTDPETLNEAPYESASMGCQIGVEDIANERGGPAMSLVGVHFKFAAKPCPGTSDDMELGMRGQLARLQTNGASAGSRLMDGIICMVFY